MIKVLLVLLYIWDVIFTFIDETQLKYWYKLHLFIKNLQNKKNIAKSKSKDHPNALQSWGD